MHTHAGEQIVLRGTNVQVTDCEHALRNAAGPERGYCSEMQHGQPALREQDSLRESGFEKNILIRYPSTWTDCPKDAAGGGGGWAAVHSTIRVPVWKGSDEFERIKKLAEGSQYEPASGSRPYVKGKLVVDRIERVQAPQIWEQYSMRRSAVAEQNGDDANEQWLWHGTCGTSDESKVKVK